MSGFVDHCIELLQGQGPVRTRRMFGGVGVYIDDLFVAII
ncbi:MAG TPA: TfoX/Sxy family protein, partial [Burkholderiaceae bacterium]